MKLKLTLLLLVALLATACATKHKRLMSPFPSTVPSVSLPNTHKVSDGLYRGMAPATQIEAKELANLGIKEVVIFRTDNKKESSVDEERVLLQSVGVASDRITHIPFKWKDITEFAEPCRQTIQALKRIHAAKKEKRTLFYHCTVGEDRTGYLTGLYRQIFEKADIKTAFKNDMCANGYAEANPSKPDWVSEKVRKNITPLYLKMSVLVRKGLISKYRLDEKVCEKEPKMTEKPEDFRCVVKR